MKFGSAVALLQAAAQGDLGELPLNISERAAVTVMLVSEGYPGSYPKGRAISIDGVVDESILFHAGTKIDDNGLLVTSGGRVISVSSMADSVAEALEKSYRTADKVNFEGKNLRRDIGRDLLRLQESK